MAIVTGTAAALGAARLIAPRVAAPAARRLSLMLLKRKGAQMAASAATKAKPLVSRVAGTKIGGKVTGALRKGRDLAKIGGKKFNQSMDKFDQSMEQAMVQRTLGKADPSRIDPNAVGRTFRTLPRVSATAQMNRLLSNPRNIVGIGGKIGKGLILWDAAQKTKAVFNPKDNIVHSVRNLGLAIKGDKTTKRHGQGQLAKMQNKRIEQAERAKLLLSNLSKADKLKVEQTLESQQKEKIVQGQSGEITLPEVEKVIQEQAQQSLDPLVREIPTTGVPTIEDDGGRAEWLAKTANSPAAQAGFSDDERWALQQKHRAWKKGRKKKRK